MFCGMNTQRQQQVFGAQCLYRVATDIREGRALEETLHVEVDGKKSRHDCPLHLQKILPQWAVEGAFVSRTLGCSLLRGGELDIWNIAQRLQRFASTREVRGPNQDVEIVELAKGKIAVNSFGQHRALIRDRVDRLRFQAVENANQFPDKDEIAFRVTLIALAQFTLNWRRNSRINVAQCTVHEWRNTMMLGEPKQPLPVEA